MAAQEPRDEKGEMSFLQSSFWKIFRCDTDGCDAPVLVVQEPGVSVLSKPPYALTQAA